MVVLGIDPGLSVSGFGVLRREGSKVVVLDYGALTMSSTRSIAERVRTFHDFFENKIVQHSVTLVALETPFLGKNAQNFLKLGYLRGILYLLSDRHQLNVREFAPMEVKRAVTGFGGADKDQVARIMVRLFPGMTTPHLRDVTDALAVSLCGMWRSNDRMPVANY